MSLLLIAPLLLLSAAFQQPTKQAYVVQSQLYETERSVTVMALQVSKQDRVTLAEFCDPAVFKSLRKLEKTKEAKLLQRPALSVVEGEAAEIKVAQKDEPGTNLFRLKITVKPSGTDIALDIEAEANKSSTEPLFSWKGKAAASDGMPTALFVEPPEGSRKNLILVITVQKRAQ